MSSLRIPYHSLSPAAFRAFVAAEAAVGQSTLGRQLILLVFLRISQMNGCAYCIDKHARDLIKEGEDFQRVNSLSTWRETNFYSDRERAALAWAEAVTLFESQGMYDEAFQQLKKHFSEVEIANLGFAAALMNAWNRIAVSFRQPVIKAPFSV